MASTAEMDGRMVCSGKRAIAGKRQRPFLREMREKEREREERDGLIFEMVKEEEEGAVYIHTREWGPYCVFEMMCTCESFATLLRIICFVISPTIFSFLSSVENLKCTHWTF